jgi:hypothetical protein
MLATLYLILVFGLYNLGIDVCERGWRHALRTPALIQIKKRLTSLLAAWPRVL